MMRFLNGSDAPNFHTFQNDLVVGVQSLIPEDKYAQMLKESHFGLVASTDFYGYNQASFPFWSSEPFTYAAAMLSLTKYRALLDSGKLERP